jgi:beta-lactamase class A
MGKTKKYILLMLGGASIFLSGIFGGYILFSNNSVSKSDEQNLREKEKWEYINPLLDCGEISNLSNKDVEALKNKVLDFIAVQKQAGAIDSAAVYFRDLNNGPWFGISEREKFYPASLLKVPLMMSVLRQSMDDSSFLGRQVVWQGSSKNNEYFKAEHELESGQSYAVGEALSFMIKYSDNNAADALVSVIDKDSLLKSYADLGVEWPKDASYEISVRTYSSFFRILYNSTFLNKEYSEDALHLLSDTAFSNGLVKKLPPSIKVAHKFGEREIDGSLKQFHDCGIVYFPQKPYLLCVMTRGNSFDRMADFVAETSKIIFDSFKKE